MYVSNPAFGTYDMIGSCRLRVSISLLQHSTFIKFDASLMNLSSSSPCHGKRQGHLYWACRQSCSIHVAVYFAKLKHLNKVDHDQERGYIFSNITPQFSKKHLAWLEIGCSGPSALLSIPTYIFGNGRLPDPICGLTLHASLVSACGLVLVFGARFSVRLVTTYLSDKWINRIA